MMKVKALCAGAGLALVAGLTMGAAMKPNLAADDRPKGPQVVADWTQAPTGPFDDGVSMAYARYSGAIPEYVTGTDLKKAMAWPEQARVDQPPEAQFSAEAYEAQLAKLDHADYADPSAEASFPSMEGGRAYDAPSGLGEPGAAPAAPIFDEDVAPEATGDTLPAQG
jgi:hypothetical protein